MDASKLQLKRKDKDLKKEQAMDENSSGKKQKKEVPFLKAYKKLHRKEYAYGNEAGYYLKRIGEECVGDARLPLLEGEWFKNKDVLDVGCHEGYIAITLAQTYNVRSMHGVDIDNVDDKDNLNLYRDEDYDLLERVTFEEANFLDYKIEECSFDTVLCLSVTKWIHLNWGDEGLKSLFKKIYSLLRLKVYQLQMNHANLNVYKDVTFSFGGILILEPQAWKSYRKNRKTTENIHENYLKIILRPHDLPSILINEVGFNSCKVITRVIPGIEKGFDRPMYLYTK